MSDGSDGGREDPRAEGLSQGKGADWAGRFFDLYPRPHFIVTRDLTLLGRNKAAAALLALERGLQVRDGQFTARDRKAAQRLAEIARLVTVDEPVLEVFAGARGLYALRAVALSDEADSPIALSFREGATDTLACADLSDPFGVTPSEQKIIEALLRGATSQEIAEEQGKSVLTVRTHIKRAYAKLGVTNREQLFARLLPFLEG